MATCKDCIHGEICDMFAHIRTLICADRADKMCKMFKSTADVVPKSEVADLQDALQCEKETNKHLSDEYIALQKALDAYEETSGLKQAKAEVAREIFAEIDIQLAFLKRYGNVSKTTDLIFNIIAELKKKYTGGEATDG